MMTTEEAVATRNRIVSIAPSCDARWEMHAQRGEFDRNVIEHLLPPADGIGERIRVVSSRVDGGG